MDQITCPFCSHSCRPTAILCPSCGLTFQRWLESNPGKTIPGWTGPAAQSVPSTPAAQSAPSNQQTASQPAVVVPPPPPAEPKKELDPKAKALIELYKTEAAFRQNPSSADIAPGRAGMIYIVMAIVNVVSAMILATQRFPGDGLAFIDLAFAGFGFVILSVGALQGHPKFVRPGVVLGVVDIAIGLSVWSRTGPSIHNMILLKMMMVAYLVKLAIDLG